MTWIKADQPAELKLRIKGLPIPIVACTRVTLPDVSRASASHALGQRRNPGARGKVCPTLDGASVTAAEIRDATRIYC